MIDFIHLLPVPTFITDFEGDFIDANNLLLQNNRSQSIIKMQKTTAQDYFVDPNTLKKMKQEIISGKIITNQLLPMKDFEKNITFRTASARVLSDVDKLIIVQTIPNVHLDNFISTKFAELLTNIKNLKPYLNRQGKLMLEEIYYHNNNIVKNENLYAYLESVSKQLLQFFPVLTCKEILVSAYITVGFSTKEITTIAGLSPNSLRVHIHNICQKLQISSRDELVQLLKQHNPIV